MPCNDVTERLELRLDAADRVQSFSLSKNTCGAPVGNALLLAFIKDHPAEEILHGRLAELVPNVAASRTLDQFLLDKQLFAVQACLASFFGNEPASVNDVFTMGRLEYDDNGTVIEGLVRIDLVTERIRACGNCGCAKKQTTPQPN